MCANLWTSGGWWWSTLILMLMVFTNRNNVSCSAKTQFGPRQRYESKDLDLDIPQQIHISIGRNLNEIAVTWTTYDSCRHESLVRYGHNNKTLDHLVGGVCEEFIDGGPLKRKHYIHRVLLVGLKPLTKYYYQCGTSAKKWSKTYSFKSLANDDDLGWNARLLIYGDLGLSNAQSVPRIMDEVENDNVDLILHVGDFAYDMHEDDSRVGDEFMRMMEPIASRVPYQTCPGNHEYAYNFSNYINRFTMYDMNSRQRSNNHFYTFHLGPIQFIAFSTEFYFFREFGWSQIFRQYQWLEETLSEANKPENRRQRPWIITFGHRPMYCSNDNDDDCTRFESTIRKGLPILGLGLEDLFRKYNVDLEIWAHEHSYERLWPIYDFKVYNGSAEHPYTNPSAPVHIITGSAGCREDLDPFRPTGPWSAKRISDYGFTRMQIMNKTHLSFEQISDDKSGTVVDSFTLIKTTKYDN